MVVLGAVRVVTAAVAGGRSRPGERVRTIVERIEATPPCALGGDWGRGDFCGDEERAVCVGEAARGDILLPYVAGARTGEAARTSNPSFKRVSIFL